MTSYAVTLRGELAGRALSLFLVLWAVSLITFFMANLLPGDPVLALLGENATPETIAYWEQEFGLDKPIMIRYTDWLLGVFQGDLGISYQTREPVLEVILRGLPVTLELLVVSTVIALFIAIPSAVISAWRRRNAFDKVSQAASMGLLATPPFMIGILLILLFSVKLNWFPATGYVPLTESITGNILSIALPSMALALNEYPVYLRILRADLIQTLQQDYISVAKAKGLSTARILTVHALRPSSLSLMTVLGVNLGRLIGGTIIIEVLFALPGIGGVLIGAIYEQDYMVIQGVVLFIAASFVLINALVDLTYRYLDPRSSHD